MRTMISGASSPIHVYDAGTGHCILTVLRPGKTPDGKEKVSAHLRLIGGAHQVALAKHPHHHPWRQSLRPTWKRWIGARRTGDPLHLRPAPPTRSCQPLRSSPRPMTSASGARLPSLDLVRDYTETRYGAKSWSHPRRVVAARIEATRKGLDVRYPASLPTSPTGMPPRGSTTVSTAHVDRRRT